MAVANIEPSQALSTQLHKPSVATATELPKPAWGIKQTIAVPPHVHQSGRAVIVGLEWGPNSMKAKARGWLYYIAFPEGGPAFQASEEELIEWLRESIAATRKSK